MHRFFKSPAAKSGVAIVVVVGIVAWALWPSRVPAPVEANRVWHPDGYSVIQPPDWRTVLETAEATLTPKRNRGWLKVEPSKQGYFPPSLMILVLPTAPDAEKLKADRFGEGTFHGLPAQIANYRDGKQWAYRIIFQDHDKWFEINLTTPDFEDGPRSPWWAYVDSFRYEPEKAVKKAPSTTATELHFSTTLPAGLTK